MTLIIITTIIPTMITLTTAPSSSPFSPSGAQDAITLLSNATAWRTYPCGETSLATFFPASPEGLPTTWASLDRIKAEVRQVEDYLCHNYSVIVSEVASDAKLTNSVRALVSGLRR